MSLATIDKSHGPQGQVRLWALEVTTTAGRAGNRVSAQVTSSMRLHTATLQQRIDTLLGVGGSNLQIVGDNKAGRARLRLKILDELSAETIDMHGLLDKVIRDNPRTPASTRCTPTSRSTRPTPSPPPARAWTTVCA